MPSWAVATRPAWISCSGPMVVPGANRSRSLTLMMLKDFLKILVNPRLGSLAQARTGPSSHAFPAALCPFRRSQILESHDGYPCSCLEWFPFTGR